MYLPEGRAVGRDVRCAVHWRRVRVLRWAWHSARAVRRSATDVRLAASESHWGAHSEVSPELARRSAQQVRVAVSHRERRVRPAGRLARAGLRRVAQVPVVEQVVVADAEPHPDAAVEALPQAVLDARVRRADELAAAARHGERVAAVRCEPQVPAVPLADAEARPSEPEAVQPWAEGAVRLSAAQEVLAVARRAAEQPSAASCLPEPSADRERPAPSEMMAMVRHEQIATWKMRRSRAGSISACSYPPFDGCPSARFIDITRCHARWTDNGEAAMWRDARRNELLSCRTMITWNIALENEELFIGMNCS